MSQQIFFAHANGFPSATYGKLFAALAPDYQVQHLLQHGHDPRFPVDDNWLNLVDELLHHLAQQPGPVWGVGHSLGGVLHLHAALRCPHYYRGVVMLDSPVLTRADQWLLRTAKRFGFIDRITPAGRTLGRRGCPLEHVRTACGVQREVADPEVGCPLHGPLPSSPPGVRRILRLC